MKPTYNEVSRLVKPTLDLRGLLVDLVQADCRFVVIGSSALAMQHWRVSPGDLDLMAEPGEVGRIAAAVGQSESDGTEVRDGEALRREFQTPRGALDVYLQVSGGLGFEVVRRSALTVSLGDDGSVLVGSLEHVRDMRAAVGRDALPEEAIAPADSPGAPHVVAIDGPAGAGKSTVTRMVAREIDFTYLNTGAMYRCVTLAVLRSGADPDDRDAIAEISNGAEIEFRGERVFLAGEDVSEAIRSDDVTTATSHIAAYPEVRAAMVSRQRALFADQGFVAEGRDTGTVVAPQAPLKVYLTASPEERARRRAIETGEEVSAVQAALEERDRLDEERKMSALRKAEEAVVVDTTGRSVQDVVDEIVALARERGIV